MAAFPAAAELVPGLRTIVVAGPRIDPATLPAADGLEGSRPPPRPLPGRSPHGLRPRHARRHRKEIGRDVDYRPVETDGARVAARRIAELLD